jgi:Domain of unknown function (DUF3527)
MSSLIEPQPLERPLKEKPALLPHPPKAPPGAISTKFHDKAKAHRVLKRTSVPPIPLKSSKPWPGSASKPTSTADELIKHMSNVPSYLQRATHPKGDDIQGKALNVGVLQWGALERYTDTKVAFPSSSQSSAPTKQQQQQQQPTKQQQQPAESSEREAGSSKRGRQSPLRRMLDPLLKPRNAVSASHHELAPAGLRRPLSSSFSLSSKKKDCRTGPSTCTEGTASTITPSFQPLSNGNLHLQQAEKIIQPLTRQALLQLAWKRGFPVFMLSSGESDILGATLRRKCFSDSTDYPDFSYSIFTLQESKMKGGAVWIWSGSKGKKQHLVSNIIGEVRVSTCKSKCQNNSEIYHVSREFVLVGPQLVLVANTESEIHELNTESPVNMELAAIVTNLPTNGCVCGKSAAAGSVTAILPSGIHGASAWGELAPLIERWRSGGGCDCGGWDEGCRLSLLSLEFNSEGSKSNWEETQARLKLFPQVIKAWVCFNW